MRRQSLPALSLLLASATLFVTPGISQAQPSGGASNEPADPHSSSAAANASALTSNRSAKDDAPPAFDGSSKSVTTMQLEFSLEALNGVLDRYRREGNRQAEALTLGAIANSYRALHQHQKAAEILQSELAIWRKIGDKVDEATTLAHIGDVYREWGFPEQAALFYRDALKPHPGATDKSEEAAVLNNLGLAYFALDDRKKCLKYLDQALDDYRARQDRQGEALTLTNLGSLYGFRINDLHKALDYFQQAITELELLNDRSTEANVLELAGGVWLKLQKEDMAVQSFQRALFLYGRLGDAQGQASVLKQLKTVSELQASASTH